MFVCVREREREHLSFLEATWIYPPQNQTRDIHAQRQRQTRTETETDTHRDRDGEHTHKRRSTVIHGLSADFQREKKKKRL